MMGALPNRRVLINLAIVALAGLLIFAIALPSSRVTLRDLVKQKPNPDEPAPPPKPKYKPEPDYLPPPIKDNFPLLATSSPPPIPQWNQPRQDAHKTYNLPAAPPLFIGFTRTWPVLQQAVVSYITAGWPASQIYVIENTGVQQANARGQLSLQNPFFLNHTALHALGVNIIQTPTLLSFAQMQNFFLSLTYAYDWPYFFWSHMDVLALAYEDGRAGLTPRYDAPGYKSLYELALTALQTTQEKGHKWGLRFFSYDHLTLVNPKAYEDVGGWDTLIPYYMTDCDMHSRLTMRGWTIEDAKAGIITDVASALGDLSALYRVDGVEPKFVDPNPPPPKEEGGKSKQRVKRDEDPNLAKWNALRKTADRMFQHKHGDRERNTWQLGQHGGEGEPFYYNAAGLAEGIEVMTETGREMYRRKWGHRDCELIKKGGLKFEDAWRVEKDWD
ncbi:hypothetical protein B0J18DRAFT_297842 [Chaetomium sp. MPI-SDFR-AT-0129]|nr:hypothetical protein B0J18DRAFT_297842 [Chaetomium sp. MPI-SDFR-AT-0129]